MDICGTASESGEHTLGFGAFNEEHKLTGIQTPINREYISSNTYRTFKFLAKLDENGEFYQIRDPEEVKKSMDDFWKHKR